MAVSGIPEKDEYQHLLTTKATAFGIEYSWLKEVEKYLNFNHDLFGILNEINKRAAGILDVCKPTVHTVEEVGHFLPSETDFDEIKTLLDPLIEKNVKTMQLIQESCFGEENYKRLLEFVKNMNGDTDEHIRNEVLTMIHSVFDQISYRTKLITSLTSELDPKKYKELIETTKTDQNINFPSSKEYKSHATRMNNHIRSFEHRYRATAQALAPLTSVTATLINTQKGFSDELSNLFPGNPDIESSDVEQFVLEVTALLGRKRNEIKDKGDSLQSSRELFDALQTMLTEFNHLFESIKNLHLKNDEPFRTLEVMVNNQKISILSSSEVKNLNKLLATIGTVVNDALKKIETECFDAYRKPLRALENVKSFKDSEALKKAKIRAEKISKKTTDIIKTFRASVVESKTMAIWFEGVGKILSGMTVYTDATRDIQDHSKKVIKPLLAKVNVIYDEIDELEKDLLKNVLSKLDQKSAKKTDLQLKLESFVTAEPNYHEKYTVLDNMSKIFARNLKIHSVLRQLYEKMRHESFKIPEFKKTVHGFLVKVPPHYFRNPLDQKMKQLTEEIRSTFEIFWDTCYGKDHQQYKKLTEKLKNAKPNEWTKITSNDLDRITAVANTIDGRLTEITHLYIDIPFDKITIHLLNLRKTIRGLETEDGTSATPFIDANRDLEISGLFEHMPVALDEVMAGIEKVKSTAETVTTELKGFNAEVISMFERK